MSVVKGVLQSHGGSFTSEDQTEGMHTARTGRFSAASHDAADHGGLRRRPKVNDHSRYMLRTRAHGDAARRRRGLLAPVRVSVESMLANLVIEANRFEAAAHPLGASTDY